MAWEPWQRRLIKAARQKQCSCMWVYGGNQRLHYVDNEIAVGVDWMRENLPTCYAGFMKILLTGRSGDFRKKGYLGFQQFTDLERAERWDKRVVRLRERREEARKLREEDAIRLETNRARKIIQATGVTYYTVNTQTGAIGRLGCRASQGPKGGEDGK